MVKAEKERTGVRARARKRSHDEEMQREKATKSESFHCVVFVAPSLFFWRFGWSNQVFVSLGLH